MKKNNVLLIFLLTIFSPTLLYGQTAVTTPLKIGIFPYLSTHTLLKKWRPLGEYIEKQSDNTVVLITAPDYKTFVERTRSKSYSFLITASHFAQLAVQEDNYIPLIGPAAKLYGVFLVKKESPFSTLQDLKGKRLATPDPLAVITISGIHTLESNNLFPGKDIFLTKLPSHNSAVLSVVEGKNDAALCSAKAFRIMREQTRSEVREIHRTEDIPFPIVFLANPSVSENQIESFTNILNDYFTKSPQGRQFVENAGYGKMIKVDNQTLEGLSKYIPEVKRQLSGQQ